MYDYGQLVYLDNQKTGGTFVSKFLQECCTLDLVSYEFRTKHRAVAEQYREDATYFSTVREPFDLYGSLYRYGQSNMGITWKRVRNRKRLDLYDDFPKWLEFILDPQNERIFESDYHGFSAMDVGIMSFRSMRITVKDPKADLGSTKTYDELIEQWDRCQISDFIFKQEDLNRCLFRFATKSVPDYFDQDEVVKFLSQPPKVNVTKVKTSLEFPPSLRTEIEKREKFLIDRYYRVPAWKRAVERVKSVWEKSVA